MRSLIFLLEVWITAVAVPLETPAQEDVHLIDAFESPASTSGDEKQTNPLNFTKQKLEKVEREIEEVKEELSKSFEKGARVNIFKYLIK